MKVIRIRDSPAAINFGLNLDEFIDGYKQTAAEIDSDERTSNAGKEPGVMALS